MNFLALCNRVKRECGASGSAMATVLNQPEDLARIVDWTATAFMDLQMAHEDWQWMRAQASFATTAGKAIYTPAECGVNNFGAWDRDTFRSYRTSTGQQSEIFLPHRHYAEWRDLYQLGANRTTQSQPVEMTITPEKGVGLGPVPATGYTITGDYFTTPVLLAQDADIPALPEQYHMLIVYMAMQHYGAFEAASEVFQRGKAEADKMLRRLTASRLPEILMPGALC